MKSWLAFSVLLLVGLFIAAKGIFGPRHNWDMLAYVACAKSFELKDKEALHNFVYDELEKSVPEKNYNRLVKGGEYEKIMAQDAEAFHQQLPYYQIRVVYNFSVFLLSKAGLNIYFSTHLISSLGILAGMFVLFFAFKPYIDNYLLIAFPLFALSLDLIDISTNSSPDGLVFLTGAAISYALLRKHWLFYVLLPFSILVRTDMILFAVPLSLYFVLFDKEKRVHASIALCLSLVGYLAINKLYGNYGWSTVFTLTFIERITYPETADIHVTPAVYLKVLLSRAPSLAMNSPFLFYLTIIVLSTVLYFKSFGPRLPWKLDQPAQTICPLSLISFAYVLAHYALFPISYTRFFASQYMFGVLGLLYLVNRSFYKGLEENQPPA